MSDEFFCKTSACIDKHDPRVFKNSPGAMETGVRLYCYTHGSTWSLQVRDHLALANGMRSDAAFVVASAYLKPDDLRALRDACTAQLVRCGLEPERKPRKVKR